MFKIDDGNLVRIKDIGKRVKTGDVVGLEKKGYLRFNSKGKSYSVHNVIWMIHNQLDIPSGMVVDHIDGNPLNNRPENLRLATIMQNSYNSKLYTSNTSGYKGVSFDRETGKWLAQIRIDGRNKKLGRYLTAELANEAVVKVRAVEHGRFANDGL